MAIKTPKTSEIYEEREKEYVLIIIIQFIMIGERRFLTDPTTNKKQESRIALYGIFGLGLAN